MVIEAASEEAAALPAEGKPIAARPHVIELDVDGSSVWVWRGADVAMGTAIVDALKAGK